MTPQHLRASLAEWSVRRLDGGAGVPSAARSPSRAPLPKEHAAAQRTDFPRSGRNRPGHVLAAAKPGGEDWRRHHVRGPASPLRMGASTPAASLPLSASAAGTSSRLPEKGRKPRGPDALSPPLPFLGSSGKLRQQTLNGEGALGPFLSAGKQLLGPQVGRGERLSISKCCARFLKLERWAPALTTCRCLHPLILLGRGGGSVVTASACACDPKTWHLPRRGWGPWGLPAPVRAAQGFLLWGARRVAMETSEGPGRSRSRRGREGAPGTFGPFLGRMGLRVTHQPATRPFPRPDHSQGISTGIFLRRVWWVLNSRPDLPGQRCRAKVQNGNQDALGLGKSRAGSEPRIFRRIFLFL